MNWVNIELLAFALFSIVMLYAKARYRTFENERGEDADGHL
jgi:hypothetical protein